MNKWLACAIPCCVISGVILMGNIHVDAKKCLTFVSENKEIQVPGFTYYLLPLSSQKRWGPLEPLVHERKELPKVDTTEGSVKATESLSPRGAKTERRDRLRRFKVKGSFSPRITKADAPISPRETATKVDGPVSPRGVETKGSVKEKVLGSPREIKSKLLSPRRFKRRHMVPLNLDSVSREESTDSPREKQSEGPALVPESSSAERSVGEELTTIEKIGVEGDPILLKGLGDLIELLPTAARNRQGHPVDEDDINGDTLFVTEHVRKLEDKVKDSVLITYLNGVFAGLQDEDKRASSKGSKILSRQSSHRFSLIALQGSDKRMSQALSTSGGKGVTSGAFTGLSQAQPIPGRDSVRPPGLNQTWGKLYQLALEFDMKPVANMLAHGIIHCLPKGQPISLQGALLENGFGSFADSQLGYLKKNLALQELGVAEVTVADYIAGIKGVENCVDQLGVVDLSNKGLTSLDGIQLVRDSKTPVTKIILSGNKILDHRFDPDFPTRPFEGFDQLLMLCLDRNCFTSLPRDIFQGAPALEVVMLEGNYLPDRPILPEIPSTIMSLKLYPTAKEPRPFGYR